MSIIAGQAVRGKNFWDRPFIMEDIFDVVENGGHILLVAPRRVGKTSIMYRIQDTAPNDYTVIYVNTEASHSSDEFWEKLFEQLMEEDFLNSISNKTKNFYNKIKSIRISEASYNGIKFGDSEPVNYEKAFEELLKSYDGKKKLIIMMDEFSQTIENIIQYKTIKEAEKLLGEHRSLRQNHKLLKKTVFVYAGSIGLESVVAKIQSSKYINDLNNIDIPPLENSDAMCFAKHLFESNKIKITKSDIQNMLKRIEWLIPFNIQIVAQEIKRLYRRSPSIDTAVIDNAIENALKHKKDFVHWYERLRNFEKDEYQFSIEILNTLAVESKISSRKIANITKKQALDDSLAKAVIHALKYDGYINNTKNPKIYHFNSPILKTWWLRNVTN